MFVTIFLVVACSSLFAVLASLVVTRSSSRSAVWNMGIGALLALAAIAGAIGIALILARSVFRR